MKLLERPLANQFIWLLLILFPIICYWQISLMQWSMKFDMVDAFLPWRYHISESIRNGYFPLWNPFQHLGYPIHSDPSSGAWYPVVCLFSFLFGYNISTIHAEYIVHIIIGGAGMFFLARYFKQSAAIALIIAVAYQGCGFFIGNAQHLTYVISGAWLPWILYLYLFTLSHWKIYAALATGVCMFMMLTGGYPAFTVILHYGLFFLFLWRAVKNIYDKKYSLLRKLIGYNALIYLIFILLSFGFLYSFYQVFPYITRNELNLSQILFGAFTPISTISMLFPFATLKETAFFNSDISMINAYMGLIPLIFFIYSFFTKKNYRWWLLIISGILFLLISFGEALPFREWLYNWVPFMDSFRFPAIFRYFFMLSIFLLAAYGLNEYLYESTNNKTLKWIVVSLSFLLLVVIVFAAYNVQSPWLPQFWNMDLFYQKFEYSTIWQHVLFQGLIQFFLLLIILITLFFIRNKNALLNILLIITALDMLIAVQLHLGGTAVSNVRASEVQQKIKIMPDGFPIPSETPISAVTDHNHYFPPVWHNLSIFHKRTARDGFNSFMLSSYDNLSESENVDDILNHPLVYVKDSGANNVEIIEFSPNQIKIHTSISAPDTLMFLQNYLPCWEASANTGELNVFIKDISLMAVKVTPEMEFVEFSYKPSGIKLLYIFTGAIFLISLIFLVFLKLRNY